MSPGNEWNKMNLNVDIVEFLAAFNTSVSRARKWNQALHLETECVCPECGTASQQGTITLSLSILFREPLWSLVRSLDLTRQPSWWWRKIKDVLLKSGISKHTTVGTVEGCTRHKPANPSTGTFEGTDPHVEPFKSHNPGRKVVFKCPLLRWPDW